MESRERNLSDLIKKLSERIKHAGDNLGPGERNEEWTKNALIIPLLEGLGWDRGLDIGYEYSPDDTDERLDFILKCERPIGIEAKKLDVSAPQKRNHLHIEKGLRQCKERESPYFIWTNGDCWQFFSLALPNAPFYQVVLSEAGEVQSNERKLHIIEKELFTANPEETFDEAIRANWKITALPAAWKMLLQEHTNDLFQLIRECLPAELNIDNMEIERFNKKILEFVETFKPDIDGPRPKPTLEFPDAWKQLLDPMETKYDGNRKSLRSGNYRKLGDYLISENYKPWSRGATWKLLGVANKTNERKGLSGVISQFRRWRFIEDAEGDKYKRVEQSVDYLKKLLE
jgi:hypothetical protein